MIGVEQLRDFVSGHYTNAVLSGRIKNDKIELKLRMNSRERKKEYIHLYNVDLENLIKNPSELVDYMISVFLETNTIIGTNYFKEVLYHNDKNGFIFDFLLYFTESINDLCTSQPGPIPRGSRCLKPYDS